MKELEATNQDLTTLLLQFNSVSELMSRFPLSLKKDRALESITSGVREELAFDRVAVWKYDPLSRSFAGRAAAGVPEELIRSLRFPMHVCLPFVRQAINEGRVLRQDPSLLAPLMESVYESLGEPPKPALIAPLLSRGKDRCWRVRRIADGCVKAEAGPQRGSSIVLDEAHVHGSCLVCTVFPVEGFLWADNAATGRPIHDDLLPLNLYLGHADLMIENAALYEELSEVTIKDALTGVYNAAYFRNLVQIETERSLRYGHPASVLFLDVKGMGRINETAGQIAGDRFLTVLGELIRTRLRRIDFVARWGGDEFGILLPHTDGDCALKVAERLQRIVASHAFDLPGLAGPIRFSAGLAVVPENAADPEVLISLAELALHEAQGQGGGTTVRIGDPKAAEVT